MCKFPMALAPFSIIYSLSRRGLPRDPNAENHGQKQQANNPSKIHLLRCVKIKSNNEKV